MKYIFILLSTLVTGCAGHITLKSNPSQAKVELVSVKDQSTIPIGETPLQVMIDDIDKKQNSGPYILRISKEGFAPRELIFVSLTGLQLDYNFDLKKSTGAAATNKIIEGLFQAQSLAQKSEYIKAVNKLDEMAKEFPEVSAIYEMRGSIYMLRSEFAAATQDFQRALQFEPESAELKSLLKSAQAKGGR
ncbi:MAG: hypothetical protein AABZ31_06900 [Bdellovibrionota bacterium]